jgi:ribose transport system ATP-binding protein
MSHPSQLLRVESVSKRFPGVVALDQVSLEVRPGEVLSVIGENGAGKSTLMKILAGVQPPDAGRLIWDGQPVTIDDVATAQQLGISLIHQELYLCQNLDLASNVYLGREPRRAGFIRERLMHRNAAEFLRSVGVTLPSTTLTGTLTIGQQQMVEIAKAISSNARLIIMDEPTSSLSHRESENLFRIIAELKASGVSVVYISHRLAEVEQLSDRVVVLRDGRNAGELVGEEINYRKMVHAMVGRELSNFYSRHRSARDDVALRVSDLRTTAFPLHRVSFEIRVGEMVGIAGLVGAGRTELLTTLFGITPPRSGEISLHGQTVEIDSPQTAIRNGMALVPEDRKAHGVVLPMSVRENTTLAMLKRVQRLGLIDFNRDRTIAEEMRMQLGVKTPHVDQPVKFLSGGNQQKVVIAKWLAHGMKVLLLDEPTRGVDVGARHEIYRLMDDLARQGVAIVFVTSDLEEALGMADRLLVMHEGQLAGELERDAFSERAVMRLATGALE